MRNSLERNNKIKVLQQKTSLLKNYVCEFFGVKISYTVN